MVSKESVEVLPQASKPVFDTIVPIQEKDALTVSEEQEIISKIISELSFSVMTAEESAKNNIEKLQYKYSELPKDPYRIELNEELILSKEAKAVSLELLNGFCKGRRKLGKKRTVTREFIEMIVSNCIYHHDYDICVSMSNKKNYISENGIARNPDIEKKIINYLVSVGFITLVDGQSYEASQRQQALKLSYQRLKSLLKHLGNILI